MSDQWEFYPTQMGEFTAFVLVNISIGEVLKERGRTGQVLLRAKLKHPREDGLTSNEEFQSLSELEDGITNYCQAAGADMVGRVTVAGFRDFVVYAEDSETVLHGLRTIAEDEHGYEVEHLTRDDPEFEVYWEHLYPGPIDQQMIHNRNLCEQLEEHGDPCETARPVEHWVSFEAAEPRAQFEQRVAAEGFAVRSRLEPDADNPHFGVQIVRNDKPEFEAISDVTLTLFRLAEEFDGSYDGWETQVLAPDDEASG